MWSKDPPTDHPSHINLTTPYGGSFGDTPGVKKSEMIRNDEQLHFQVTSLFQYGFRISKGTPREMAPNQGVMRIDVHL